MEFRGLRLAGGLVEMWPEEKELEVATQMAEERIALRDAAARAKADAEAVQPTAAELAVLAKGEKAARKLRKKLAKQVKHCLSMPSAVLQPTFTTAGRRATRTLTSGKAQLRTALRSECQKVKFTLG